MPLTQNSPNLKEAVDRINHLYTSVERTLNLYLEHMLADNIKRLITQESLEHYAGLRNEMRKNVDGLHGLAKILGISIEIEKAVDSFDNIDENFKEIYSSLIVKVGESK